MKLISRLYLLLIIGLSCAADKHSGQMQSEVVLPIQQISFEVDSIKVFVFDSLNLSSFIFSPIEDKDHIWCFGGGKNYDVNLLTNERILLKDKYPTLGLSQVDPIEIWKDSIRSEVFISPFHGKKLVQYSIKKGKTNEYPINLITSCVNSTDILLVGTAKGLFKIDKNTTQFQKATEVPRDFWINDMEVKESQILLNNGSYTVQMKLDHPVSWTRPLYQISQETSDIMRLLPGQSQVSYWSQQGQDFYLFYSFDRVFYMDSNRYLFEIDFLPKGTNISLLSDNKYWYILTPHQIMIINRQYVIKNSRPYYYKAYQETLKTCRDKISTLNGLSMDDFIKQFQIINSDSNCLKLDEYEEWVSSTAYYYFRNAAFNGTEELNNYYYQGLLPRGLEEYAINALINFYTHQFDDKKVKQLIKTIESKYPDYKSFYRETNLECLGKILNSVDSLRALGLPQDEYLFKEASIKARLVTCGGFGDNYYDFTLRDENYNRILTEFPKSPYAEEIEFYRAGSEGLDAESGEPETMEGLISLDQFLKKYPNTQFKGRIEFRKAWIMSMYYMNPDSILWYKENALDVLRNIDVKYLQDTLFRNDVNNQISSLESEIFELIFDITLTVSDPDISLGEPMSFTFKVLNKSDQTHSFKVYAHKPHFALYMSNELDSQFKAEGSVIDTASKEIRLKPGELFEDVVQVPGRIRKLSFPNPRMGTMDPRQFGYLDIKKLGEYSFTAFGPNYQKLHSNGVSLFIHN